MNELLVAFGVLLSTLSGQVANTPMSLSEWEPQYGDVFVVDTLNDIGYVVHPDGSYISDHVGGGQERVVKYLGRVYDAETPSAYWKGKALVKQKDLVSFGPNGDFIRLYFDGKKTHYGIHSVGGYETMFAQEDRNFTFGCIAVKPELLDILIETLALNGDEGFNVITVKGMDVAALNDVIVSQ